MPTIPLEFLTSFQVSTAGILKIQCSTDVQSKPPFELTENPTQSTIDIAGVLSLNCKAFSGTLALCFPQKVFLHLMGKMLGEEYTEINDELRDGAGELLNIIFGDAKRGLNEKGYEIQKAIPTVISGKNLNLKHVSAHPTMVLPFTAAVGDFHMLIGRQDV